ncbi:MAG: LAGLIDADG family homing endonuclease [Acidimicrobiales bacterium]
MLPATDIASFVAGFVAAEGCFIVSGEPLSFTFAVALGAADAGTCELLAEFLGVGHVTQAPRRHAHYDDEVTFAVRSLSDLVEVVVPFMDEHLVSSYKRRQYEVWRGRLLDYWEHHAKRVRPCSVDGCALPRRARGLCRHHYYAAYHR